MMGSRYGRPAVQPATVPVPAVQFAIGVVGLLIPLVLLVGVWLFDRPIESSFSAYYHRAGFLSTLYVALWCITGTLVFSYAGYEVFERWWLRLAVGLCSCGIALFPPVEPDLGLPVEWFNWGHRASMVLFAAGMAVYLWRFQYTSLNKHALQSLPENRGKRCRNRIYLGCLIALCVGTLGAAVGTFFPTVEELLDGKFIIWSEAVAILAFVIGWAVKSGWLRRVVS